MTLFLTKMLFTDNSEVPAYQGFPGNEAVTWVSVCLLRHSCLQHCILVCELKNWLDAGGRFWQGDCGSDWSVHLVKACWLIGLAATSRLSRWPQFHRLNGICWKW